jgi:UDP-N-acetylglucosamine diphosphorylase / glucose-1-phosphate thymidylyltransferase / UDP-N-acetylgalactosamine diphosphorylase / glucosamine-1-phosphate N-acetyltransferase / galactosamine-1-phosphate N-acetyltransferase
MTPHVIIPCAGYGQRFKDAGYTMDKPLIQVGGKRLIEWVLECIPKSWHRRVVFIVRGDQPRLVDEISDLLDDSDYTRIISLAGPTQGAACSVLAAAVGLPPDEPVLVLNSDQWFTLGIDFAGDGFQDMNQLNTWALKTNLDGLILTFPGTGPAWSYAVTNGNNRVIHVIEKKQVSPYATIGAYWWRRAGDLVRSICAMISVGEKTKGEFYLAPSFNFLPLSEKDVRIMPVKEFHGLGTPEQVKEFETLLTSGWRS